MTNKMCVYHINNILICYQNAKMVNDCLFIFCCHNDFKKFRSSNLLRLQQHSLVGKIFHCQYNQWCLSVTLLPNVRLHVETIKELQRKSSIQCLHRGKKFISVFTHKLQTLETCRQRK